MTSARHEHSAAQWHCSLSFYPRCSPMARACLFCRISVSEWGDVYPLTKSSIEDQLTAESISSGLSLVCPGLRDEFSLFPFSQFQQQRLLLLKRINEAAAQPQVRRTPRPLPALSVATKEQKEEFLCLLSAVDTPLSSLLSSAPHGVKAALLLDEMWARAVSVVRAVWFIRIVYRNSVSDNARVRVSSQQRCRLWTDEVRRYMEQLVHDVTAAVRPAAAKQQQQAGIQSAFAQLMDKFQYMLVLVALTYNEGLMARVRWLDWLVDQFLALATALLSLPSSYPPSTASSTLQGFAASFILWQHKASLLFLVLAPFQSSLQLSSYHSFRLFHCLSLIRQKLRGMIAANEESRLSRERALRRCETTIEELTAAAVGGDMWEQWVSGTVQHSLTDNNDDAECSMTAAELLVKLEDVVGKGGEGADAIVGCLRAAASEGSPSFQPLHVMLEWCTHPYYSHHTESVAAVFTIVCTLTANRPSFSPSSGLSPACHDSSVATDGSPFVHSYAAFISPAAVASSPLRAYVASSLHSFLLLFPTLPAFSSTVCRHRLLCLLSHFVMVGLFDYPQYVHHLIRTDLLSLTASSISQFSAELLCYLPTPALPSASAAELRRVALYGLSVSSVRRDEAALYWHSMCVLLQRAPVMAWEAARDVWIQKRQQCAAKLQRLHVSLVRRVRGLQSYVVDAIDEDTAMLAPARLDSFLSFLPFHVSLKLLSGLLDDLLSFVQSSLPATAVWPSAVHVYVERVICYLLSLIEASPHFPLLFSSLLRLLSLSSEHRLHVEDCLFSAFRRHWMLLCCVSQSSTLHTAMMRHLRSFDEVLSAEICVEQCGLPLHFVNSVQAELSSLWQAKATSTVPLTATLLPSTARSAVSPEHLRELLERYRKRQADLPATLAAIRELSPVTVGTLHAFQREVVRHVLIVALTPALAVGSTASSSSLLYASLPHMQPDNVKLRVGELCSTLRMIAACHAEMGRERTDVATSLLRTVVLAASACDEVSASKLVATWELDEVNTGELTSPQQAERTGTLTDCLSLFVLMAINRHCLRLGRCLSHFSSELLSQPSSTCLRRMTALLFSSTGRQVRVWECDRRWMDDSIQAESEEVFRLLRVCLATASSASPAAADELLQSVVASHAVHRLCARHLPLFHQQLRSITDQQHRMAVFNYIDSAVRLADYEQPAPDAAQDGCGGMEGMSEAMVQELARQDKSRRLMSDTEAAVRTPPPLVLSASIDSASPLSLLSSLSLISLPFLHIRLQLSLDSPSRLWMSTRSCSSPHCCKPLSSPHRPTRLRQPFPTCPRSRPRPPTPLMCSSVCCARLTRSCASSWLSRSPRS